MNEKIDDIIKQAASFKNENLKEYQDCLMIGGGTEGPTLLKGEGIRVTDVYGKTYIDCTSQGYTLNLGYSNKEINELVHQQMDYLIHTHQPFNTPIRYMLAKKLVDISPPDITRVSFTVGGALAVEAALKLAIINKPNATQFISLYDAYHGTSFMTIGASWIATRSTGEYKGGAKFLPFLKDFIRIPNPYCYRCPFNLKYPDCEIYCAKVAKETIKRGSNGPVSAILIEPLQGSGGQIPCPNEYLEKMKKLCDEFEITLIFDEIQTAFGRMGTMFAAEHYGVTPDIIVVGKSMGAGFPIGAVLLNKKLKGFEPTGEELHTFANNQIAQIAALKQIEIILRDNILDHVKKMNAYFMKKLNDFYNEFEQIGDIRGPGLHIGVEFVKDRRTKEPAVKETIKIRDIGLKKGVIFGLGGAWRNVLKIKPPLIINEKEADNILEVLYECIREIF
ncbi:MAG: aspartate aminotransferase family protein [Actinobacteria bacterium]|nr:aspartate aminotransferase family protein [Actinomycetota bacterium]